MRPERKTENEREKNTKGSEEILRKSILKEYYETAPTGACKRYIELEFYYSDYRGQIPDYDELKKESDSLEEEFVRADWAHLYKYCANNPKKVYYKNKMEEHKKEE